MITEKNKPIEILKVEPLTCFILSIIKDENNNNQFVYAKAIRIKEVCLNCHGININDDLKKEIQKLYPDDKAINYKLNDLRFHAPLISTK